MTIKKRYRKNGRFSWELDCGFLNGRRIKISFKSKDEAEAEMADRKAALKQRGHSIYSISDEERARYLAVRDRLAAAGATIEQAADFYLLHAKPAKGPVRFLELRQAWEEDARERGLEKKYIAGVRVVAKAFGIGGADDQQAHEITGAQIEAWLKGNQWAWKTWNNYRTALRAVFGYGMSKGHVGRNPTDDVMVKKKPVAGEGEGEIAFLPVDVCGALLSRAARITDGHLVRDRRGLYLPVDKEKEDFRLLVPSLVLGLFAGMRPEKEVGLMRWRSIQIDDAIVVVTAGRAKTRKRRHIDLSDNAVAWLRWCQGQGMGSSPDEPILPPNYKKRWKRLREVCGVFTTWPHDGLRHTFATYHLAMHRDEARLQSYMGHEDGEMLFSHYIGLAAKAEAVKFWQLLP